MATSNIDSYVQALALLALLFYLAPMAFGRDFGGRRRRWMRVAAIAALAAAAAVAIVAEAVYLLR